jgi:hypothetical protein
MPEKANPEFRQLSRTRYAIDIQLNEDTIRALKLMTHRGGPKAKAMLTHCARVLGELSQDGVTYNEFMKRLLGDIDKMKREFDPLSPAAVEAIDLVKYISTCRKRRIAPDLSSVRTGPMWSVVEARLRQAGFPKEEINHYAKSCSGGRAWLR